MREVLSCGNDGTSVLTILLSRQGLTAVAGAAITPVACRVELRDLP
jgi:hypothetical protein